MTETQEQDWTQQLAEFFRENRPPPTIQQKLQPQDHFWDQREGERLVVQDFDMEIGNVKSALRLADKAMMVQNSPGWDHFVKAVEDCRAYRRQEMELSSGTDIELRILQGRVRELGAILSLMKNHASNSKALASRLEFLESERKKYVREDGKVRPKGVAV